MARGQEACDGARRNVKPAGQLQSTMDEEVKQCC